MCNMAIFLNVGMLVLFVGFLKFVMSCNFFSHSK